MSLYDIAVQKLGFPTIELFVKVGLRTSFDSNSRKGNTELSFLCSFTLCVFVFRRAAMGKALAIVLSLKDSLWSSGSKASSLTSPLLT